MLMSTFIEAKEICADLVTGYGNELDQATVEVF
jgi:hypothetical protein